MSIATTIAYSLLIGALILAYCASLVGVCLGTYKVVQHLGFSPNAAGLSAMVMGVGWIAAGIAVLAGVAAECERRN